MSAETKEGNHIEGMMIISLQRLHVKRNDFESWIDLFFDRLHMSAGTLVFTEYMGEQMLSCMNRIQHSKKLRTNLFAEWNKDLLLLYQNLSKTRADQQRVLAVTDTPFTAENFINISRNNTNGHTHALQAVDLRPAAWNWRILLRTPSPPWPEVENYIVNIPNPDIWPIQTGSG